jgi:hypothetical protein
VLAERSGVLGRNRRARAGCQQDGSSKYTHQCDPKARGIPTLVTSHHELALTASMDSALALHQEHHPLTLPSPHHPLQLLEELRAPAGRGEK